MCSYFHTTFASPKRQARPLIQINNCWIMHRESILWTMDWVLTKVFVHDGALILVITLLPNFLDLVAPVHEVFSSTPILFLLVISIGENSRRFLWELYMNEIQKWVSVADLDIYLFHSLKSFNSLLTITNTWRCIVDSLSQLLHAVFCCILIKLWLIGSSSHLISVHVLVIILWCGLFTKLVAIDW